jgi:hypothetical protein
MSTETSTKTIPRRMPGFADIQHLVGCPSADNQPGWPMPADVETYTITPQKLNDREGVRAPAGPVNVSHCCKCGGMGYQRVEAR